MVTRQEIQSARKDIAGAQRRIREQRSVIQQREAEAQRARQTISNQQAQLSSQSTIRKLDIGGLAKKQQALKQLGGAKQKIAVVESQLTTAKQQVESQAKKVSEFEGQIQRTETALDERKKALEKGLRLQSLRTEKAIGQLETGIGRPLTSEEIKDIKHSIVTTKPGESVDIGKVVDIPQVQIETLADTPALAPPPKISKTKQVLGALFASRKGLVPSVTGVDTPTPAEIVVPPAIKLVTEKVLPVSSAIFLKPSTLFPSGITAVSGAELERRSQDIRAPLLESSGVTGRPTTVTGEISRLGGTGILSLIAGRVESSVRSGQELQRFKREEREAKVIANQQRKDVQIIEDKQTILEKANLMQDRLNVKIEKGNQAGGFSQIELDSISTEQSKIDNLVSGALKDDRGVKVKQEDGQISFSSDSLDVELGSGTAKQLGFIKETGGSTSIRIAGRLASEAAEFTTLGIALGATGTTARVGQAFKFLTPLIEASPVSFLATTPGLIGTGAALTGGAATLGFLKGRESGRQFGVGTEAGILGGAKPLVQAGAFVGGSVIGSRIFTAQTLRALEQGKITEAQAIKRGVRVPGQRDGFLTTQRTATKTKVPGTRITIESTGKLSAAETSKKARGAGRFVVKVKGLDTGTQKFKVEQFIFRKGTKTGTFTVRQVPKGVEISKFRTTIGDIIIDKKSLSRLLAKDSKTFSMKFTGVEERLGKAVIVRKADSLKSLDILFRKRLTDVPTAISRTAQIVTPNKQGFQTQALTRKGDIPLIEKALKKGLVLVKETSTQLILRDKRGQILALTKPLPVQIPTTTLVTTGPATQLVTPPTLTPSIVSTIAPDIARQQLSNTLTGTLASGGLLDTSVASVSITKPSSVSLTTPSIAQETRFTELTFDRPVEKTIQQSISVTAPNLAVGTPTTTATRITTTQITTPTQVTQPSTTQVTPGPTPFIPPTIITPLPPVRPTLLSSAIAKVRAGAAYDVFVKGKGKFRKVGNDLPLGRALKRGATVTKSTTASTFKVIRDKKASTNRKDINFRPSPTNFRDFRITKGRQVPLPRGPDKFVYIERKRRRITTVGEQAGLKAARKSRGFFGL